MCEERDSQSGGTLPPLEEQADIRLTPEEWEDLRRLLDFPPKATPGLRRAMARKR